jgi:hypothetical protein
MTTNKTSRKFMTTPTNGRVRIATVKKTGARYIVQQCEFKQGDLRAGIVHCWGEVAEVRGTETQHHARARVFSVHDVELTLEHKTHALCVELLKQGARVLDDVVAMRGRGSFSLMGRIAGSGERSAPKRREDEVAAELAQAAERARAMAAAKLADAKWIVGEDPNRVPSGTLGVMVHALRELADLLNEAQSKSEQARDYRNK